MSYRFALIGCGNIASRHADQINTVGRLTAVCDTDFQKAERFAQLYHTRAYPDIGRLLLAEPPDIIVICTPNGLHAPHAVLALEYGCHVLCEKPMAISVVQAHLMTDAALKSGRKLFVVKQNRYNPSVMAVKALLDEGKLGRIHSFQINCFWNRSASYYKSNWRGTLALDGGTLFTQFSHFIDLLYWWLGEIREVKGYRANALHQGLIEFEDHGAASLVLKQGAVGTIQYTINAHKENFEGSVTLFGEKGTVKVGGQYLNRIEHFQVMNTLAPIPEPSAGPNAYGTYSGSMSNHHLVYRQLVKALNDPSVAFPQAAEGLKSVEMIEQIYAGSPFVETSKAL